MIQDAAHSDGRECARGPRCLRAWTDATGERRGDWGPRPFCHACRGRLVDALTEMPELYAWLWLQLPQPLARPWDRAAARNRETPLPLRTDTDMLMRTIYDVLASWEERVRGIAHLQPATRRAQPHHPALTQIVTLLTSHIDALIALDHGPMVRRLDTLDDLTTGTIADHHHTGDYILATVLLDGADAGLEVLHLHTRARAMSGQTRRITALPGVPCPLCALCALVRVTGDAHVICRGCGATLPEDDYYRWVRARAQQVREDHDL